MGWVSNTGFPHCRPDAASRHLSSLLSVEIFQRAVGFLKRKGYAKRLRGLTDGKVIGPPGERRFVDEASGMSGRLLEAQCHDRVKAGRPSSRHVAEDDADGTRENEGQ